MPNRAAFHAQLSSIMEALTKAAVAEICELVDDGYAVLRLENEALRRELQLLARRRRRAPGAGRKGSPLPGLAMDGGEAGARAARTQPARKEEAGAEGIAIKEEKPYGSGGDPDPGRGRGRGKTGREKGEDLSSDSDNGSSTEAKTKPTHNTEKLPGPKRTKCGTSEDVGLDTVLKSEPDADTLSQRLHFGGLECSSEKPDSVDCDYGALHQRSSQLQTFFTQAGSETDTEEPACSYSVQRALSDLQAEGEPVSPVGKGGSGLLSPLAPSKKSEVVMNDAIVSVPIVDRAEVCPAWSKETMLGHAYTQHTHYNEFGETRGIQSEILANMCLPLNQVNVGKNRANSESDTSHFNTSAGLMSQRKVGTREKRFICGYCGKCFTCPKYLQTHQRVHTGEKPYSCPQCGKRFAQSGYLKKHQNVHTGAKPFGCKQCGKRFADSSNLIRHRSVHTGEKPFICTYCGERFAGKHNLKIHQQRNHPALWSVR